MNSAVKNASKYAENANKAGIDFLLVELSLGTTFMDVADTYRQREHQRQATLRAEAAYRSALNFLPRLELTDRQRIEITTKLNVLKARRLMRVLQFRSLQTQRTNSTRSE